MQGTPLLIAGRNVYRTATYNVNILYPSLLLLNFHNGARHVAHTAHHARRAHRNHRNHRRRAEEHAAGSASRKAPPPRAPRGRSRRRAAPTARPTAKPTTARKRAPTSTHALTPKHAPAPAHATTGKPAPTTTLASTRGGARRRRPLPHRRRDRHPLRSQSLHRRSIRLPPIPTNHPGDQHVKHGS